MTFIALTGRFRVIKAALDDLLRLARWTRDALWPAQLTDGLITLDVIDQILDIDLHRWIPDNEPDGLEPHRLSFSALVPRLV